MESYYENDILNGVQKRWYPNGQLVRRTHRTISKEEGLQQALIATSNKLLKQAFAIVESGLPYDENYACLPVRQVSKLA